MSVFFVVLFTLPWDKWDTDPPEERIEALVKKDPKFKTWQHSKYCAKTVAGFFLSLEKAEKSILENWADMFEDGSYNLALIEEVQEGLIPERKHWWYEVEPLYNQDEIRRREEHTRVWDEAYFFGKRLGQLLARHLEDQGHDLGTAEVGFLVGSIQTIAEVIDMNPWMDLYKIQSGSKAPVFSADQWAKLMTLGMSDAEQLELKTLQFKALRDPLFGLPPELKTGIIASSRSSSTSGDSVKSEGWLVHSYDIKKCDPPRRFGDTFSGYSF